ncbi:MAG: ThuA domain-containing protein [Vicinamibacterales bacterium]
MRIRAALVFIAVLASAFWLMEQQGTLGWSSAAGESIDGQQAGQQAPPAGARGAQDPARGRGQGTPPAGGQGRGGRAAAPRTKKVVLAWADTRNGIAQHDSVSHALAVIERIGYESGVYDTYIRTDSNIISFKPLKTDGTPASGGPSLNNVDAIFFCGHREVPLDDAGKADLVTFIRDQGKGFVAAHVGLTAFESWPEFANIIGGGFGGHIFGNVPSPLITEDPNFPAVKHFPQTIVMADEYYLPSNYSREKLRVLQRLDISGFPPNERYTRTDGDYPVTWAKMYGKGRVFYSSLGHDTKAWDNTDISRMYFEAIKWALGLTDADVTPRPLPEGVQMPGTKKTGPGQD